MVRCKEIAAALGLAATVLATTTVSAGSVQIRGRTLTLPMPQGYCEVDKTHVADLYILSNYAGNTRLRTVMVAVDCAELQEVRAEKRRTLREYALVAVPEHTLQSDVEFTQGEFDTYIYQQNALFRTPLDRSSPKVAERLAELQKKPKQRSDREVVGLTAKDSRSLYVGAVVQGPVRDSPQYAELSVLSLSIVERKGMALSIYSRSTDAPTLFVLSDRLQQWVADTHAANRR